MAASYILSRLRSDCDHVLQLAAHEGAIGHPGVKGRFRELLINNQLIPWLPPAVGCGTGIIIDGLQEVSGAGQDDVILFDSLLVPPILVSATSTSGVYLFDGVLCRIEVKSTLTRDDINAFVKASKKVASLKLAARPGRAPRAIFGALNMLLSFESRIEVGGELQCLEEFMTEHDVDPTGGIVSGLCVANRDFWLLGKDEEKLRWKRLLAEVVCDPLAFFVGVTSSAVFDQRAARHGLEPFGGGVGLYLNHPFEWVS